MDKKVLHIDINSAAEVSVNGKLLKFPDKKPRAILGILALEPGLRATRTWLMLNLWSDRSEAQALASLRQALTTIRRRLGEARIAVKINREFIALDSSLVEIPSIDKECNLLAKLYIKDPKFTHWLEKKRLSTHHSSLIHYEDNNDIVTTSQSSSLYCVGLLPTITSSQSTQLLSAGNFFLERLGQGLQQNGIAEVVDYRQIFAGLGKIQDQSIRNAELFIQTSVYQSGAKWLLTCKIYDALNNTQLWNHHIEISAHSSSLESLDIKILSNQAMDFCHFILASKLFSAHAESRAASSMALAAISEIIKAREGNLQLADKLLCKAFEIQPKSVYQAWRTQIYAYLIGERLIDEDKDKKYREKLRNIVAKTTALGRFNPVSLSLAAHAHSFIFEEYDIALELFNMVLMLKPTQAICYDMAATTNVYVDNKKEAYKQAQIALKLGQFSPFRYCIETTCSMASAINHKYREAAHYSNQALEKKPTYTVAHRYDVAANALDGNIERAKSTYKEFVKIEKDFSLDLMKRASYPVCKQSKTALLLEAGFKSVLSQ